MIAERRVDANYPNRIDRNSRREALRIADPRRDHTIGQIAFNPNARPGAADYAMLYIGVGDGGDMFPARDELDAMRNAQNSRGPSAIPCASDRCCRMDASTRCRRTTWFVEILKYLPESWVYGLRNL